MDPSRKYLYSINAVACLEAEIKSICFCILQNQSGVTVLIQFVCRCQMYINTEF